MDRNMCASCVFFCILSSKYNGFESSVSAISFISIHIYENYDTAKNRWMGYYFKAFNAHWLQICVRKSYTILKLFSQHSRCYLKNHFTNSGVATGVARGGRVRPLTATKMPKIRKNREKFRKNREKRGKIGKKRQKSGSFFHFAPPDR